MAQDFGPRGCEVVLPMTGWYWFGPWCLGGALGET